MERRTTHNYIFPDVPGLAGLTQNELLDDDIRKDVNDVLIADGRLVLKVRIGMGKH